MKKQHLRNLKLNKKSISNLRNTVIGGGSRISFKVKCPFGPTDDSLDFDCPNYPSLNPCGN